MYSGCNFSVILTWEGILNVLKRILPSLRNLLALSVFIFLILLFSIPPVVDAANTADTAVSDNGTRAGSEVSNNASTKKTDAPQAAVPKKGEALQPQNEANPAPDYTFQEPEFTRKEVSYPLLILRTVAVLGVIIIGIYLIFRLLLKNRRSPVKDSEIIRVLATYPLAANRLIQIVDIGGQVLVLGVSDSSINLITEVEDKGAIDRIRLLSSKESKGAGGFRDQFLKLIGGKSFAKPGQISYLGGYRKRIDRMKKM